MIELEPTWSIAVKVWWAYLWRSLVAIVPAFVISIVLGFVTGILFAMLGLPKDTAKLIVKITGFVMGLSISIVPMKLILGKDFGNFRLVLLSASYPLQKELDTDGNR